MKEARLSTVDRDLLASDAVPLERERIKIRAIDEKYFHVGLMAGEGKIAGGPSVVDAATFAWTVEDFPAAAATRARKTERLLNLWPRTTLRLNLWYTSPGASTNLFTLTLGVRQLDAGMLVGSSVAPIGVNFTVPGPAVANTVLFASYASGGMIFPATRLVQFTLGRIGPDANANAFRFIYADYVLEESA